MRKKRQTEFFAHRVANRCSDHLDYRRDSNPELTAVKEASMRRLPWDLYLNTASMRPFRPPTVNFHTDKSFTRCYRDFHFSRLD